MTLQYRPFMFLYFGTKNASLTQIISEILAVKHCLIFFGFFVTLTLKLSQSQPKLNDIEAILRRNFLLHFIKLSPKLRTGSQANQKPTNRQTYKWPQASNFEKKHAYMPIQLIKNKVKVMQIDQAQYPNGKAPDVDTN